MKKAGNIAILISIILILAGCVISFIGLSSIGFNFKEMSNVKFNSETVNIEEDFSDIYINSTFCDIRILPSPDGITKVYYEETEHYEISVSTENKKLSVIQTDLQEWNIFFGINFDTPQITVYLADDEFGKLTISNTSGDIEVSENLTFSDAEILTASGDIDISAQINGDVYISLTSGDIEASNIRCKDLSITGTSGDVELKNVIAEGHIEIKTVSGDISLDDCDGGTLKLKAISGDISGTLLSGKDFQPKTVSGDIRITGGKTGGICDVETTSGNIRFRTK